MNYPLLAFLDLETTGSNPLIDRITEIAILRVKNGEILESWETLVNPETSIPSHIQDLTGITNEMVSGKPTIIQIIPDILRLLQASAIVAHNAKFDVSFMKMLFAENNLPFDYTALCTLKLSRALYPAQKRHNLGELIKRHKITVNARHRALADAEALYQLMNVWINENGEKKVERFLQQQNKKTNLPKQLNQDQVADLPNSAGVYIFYGKDNIPLYVGKSIDIKSRVLSHFSDAKRNEKELRISEEIRSIEFIETAGELSALIKEAYLVKKLSPIFNRRLRKHKSLFSWYWDIDMNTSPKLVDLAKKNELSINEGSQFGLFRSKKAAENALHKISINKRLCFKVMGLEKGNGACFAYQLGKCNGICVNKENTLKHKLRIAEGLLPLKIQAWPFKGKIGIYEFNHHSNIKQTLIVDKWRLIGISENEDISEYEKFDEYYLDLDIYKVLKSYLKIKRHNIIELD